MFYRTLINATKELKEIFWKQLARRARELAIYTNGQHRKANNR